MAAPTFVAATTGVTDAGGAWTYTSGNGGTTVGNVVILQILQDGSTASAVALTSVSSARENLAGTASALTFIGSFNVGASGEAIQHLWIGRANTALSPTYSGTNSTSEDLYFREYIFTSVSLGTTLATVIENGTAGATDTTEGTSATVSAPTVTTLGPDRLAVALLAVNDDNAIAANYTGESGGDWTQAVAEYADAGGTDGAVDLEIATIASAGSISGGTKSITDSDAWGVVGFALIGTTVGGTPTRAYAQAQACIKQTYNQHAQAQARIKQVYNVHAQAQAEISRLEKFGQARAYILSQYLFIDTFERVVATGLGQSDNSDVYIEDTGSESASSVDGNKAILLGTVNWELENTPLILDQGLEIYGIVSFPNASLPTGTRDLEIGMGNNTTSNITLGVGIILTASTSLRIREALGSVNHASISTPTNNTLYHFKFHILRVSTDSNSQEYAVRASLWADGNNEPGLSTITGGETTGPNIIPTTDKVSIKLASVDRIFHLHYVQITPANIVRNGQAQALIESSSSKVHGQSEAWIENTYFGLGQAQGTILQVYYAVGQTQAQIKQTYFGLGQAQAHTVRNEYGLGQAQAKINAFDFNQHGQAQAWIAKLIASDTFDRTVALGWGESTPIPDIRWTDHAEIAPGFTDEGSVDGDYGIAPIGSSVEKRSTADDNFGYPLLNKGITQYDFWVPAVSDEFIDYNMDSAFGAIHIQPKEAPYTTWVVESLFSTPTIGFDFVPDPSTWYTVKYTTGIEELSTVYIKLWKTSDPEPIEWTYSASTTPEESPRYWVIVSSNVEESKVNNLYYWALDGTDFELRTPTGQARAFIHKTIAHGQALAVITGGFTSVTDNFGRSVSNSLGTADVGGDYLQSGSAASQWDVDGSKVIYTASTTTDSKQLLPSVLLVKGAYEALLDFRFTTFQASNSSTIHLLAESTTVGTITNGIGARLQIASTGIIQLTTRLLSSIGAQSVNLSDTYVQGETWRIKTQVLQTPAYGFRVRAKTWNLAEDEPGWQVEGASVNRAYLGSSAIHFDAATTSVVTEFDNFSVQEIGWTETGQAQAYITPDASQYALGQSQAWIENTYNQHGQAQGTVLQTYYGLGQSETWIKNTYFGLGQTNALIVRSEYGLGQAQAWIENTYYELGQAQAQIKQVYYGLGQSQADIKQVYYGLGQAQAQVKQVYYGLGQSQGTILTSYTQTGQANADIKATSNAHGQAQADVKQTYFALGQSQALIRNTYFGLGQSQAWIKQTYYGLGQAQATIRGNAHGQAQGWIETTYSQHGQAQALVKNTYYGLGQAEAWIEQTYHTVGQAQAQIKQTYTQVAQAQATILQVYYAVGQAQAYIKIVGINVHGQANALISQSYTVVAQAQAKINAYGVNQYGQAQGNIRFNGNAVHGQAQAKINAFDFNQYGQAQADIKATSTVHGQAQGTILQVYYGLGQAQARILTTYYGLGQANADILAISYVHGQANAYILLSGRNVHGQAQANIRDTYESCGQANAHILRTEYGLGQAQGTIEQVYNQHGQAQGTIEQTYNVHAQASALIKNTYYGLSQAQAKINAFGITNCGQAQAYIQTGSTVHGQAQGTIKAADYGLGQSQADIKQSYTAVGQAQADIKQTYTVVGQSNALIVTTFQGYGQAQGTIKTTYRAHGQAQGWVETTYNASGQSQALIKNTYNSSGQAEAYIILLRWGFGQAQGAVEAVYSQTGQARAHILTTASATGNAQALIRTTIIVSAQAQGWIETVSYGFGQAEAAIISGRFGTGQAQAFIFRTEAYGQAEALIVSHHFIDHIILEDDSAITIILSDDSLEQEIEDDILPTIEIEDTDIFITVTLADNSSFTIILHDEAF